VEIPVEHAVRGHLAAIDRGVVAEVRSEHGQGGGGGDELGVGRGVEQAVAVPFVKEETALNV
jgi:hypothetical protein